MEKYKRISNAGHVVATEEALKHWDTRRHRDVETSTVPRQNISAGAARLEALMRAINYMRMNAFHRNWDMESAQVLDVGCAQGYGLRPFLLAGFRMDQLHGIDLFADRVETGKQLTPGMDLQVGDATAMPYADASFDLVCEQFCFCHVPDDEAKAKIAREMMRVSKRFILIHDWRAGSASRKLYSVSPQKIRDWFPEWSPITRVRSQLWPPIGRPLSRFAWPLYDLARAFSPLVGSWITVLQRDRSHL